MEKINNLWHYLGIGRALAADYNNWNANVNINDPGRLRTLAEIMSTVIDVLLGIAGVLAVVAVVYSGLLYITAGPNTELAEKARKNLAWAVIGIIIVALSFVIVNWVIDIFK